MATFHILSQYVWPDAAPTGLYAEQLAVRLREQGCDVRLIGGQGRYRVLGRDKPPVPILHLEHYHGRRGNLGQTLVEYASVKTAFTRYIEHFVKRGDVVIATSAPPNTVQLAKSIKLRQARAIYWLQDYYPELIRGIHDYPVTLRKAFSRYWDRLLSQWDFVVKIGANLKGPQHNSVVIRNWPTLNFEEATPFETGTALYSGNLGYGHDIDLLVTACEELRDAGYRITIRADGRGVKRLPGWLKAQPLHTDPEKLKRDLLRHEVHLVAADPRIRRAIFPSKIWNSIASGRRLICTGFAGEMATELEATKLARFDTHLHQWATLLGNLVDTALPAANLAGQTYLPAAQPLDSVAIA
jgi:hypothetical protein